MTSRTWSAVDAYLEKLLRTDDPALRSALRASAAARLPSIQVSALQGRFLTCSPGSSGLVVSSRWARSEATVPSGSPGPCLPGVG